MGNGQMFLGSLVASKVFRIMHDVELGKPYMFLIGRNPARGNNDIEGRGDDKKQMAAYNELHRGFASARKGADLSEVFHCMNRDKPRNVRQSITPKSEILTDTCVNGLYAGITKTAFLNENCRPIKGDEMLERYEGKLSRTVLRGGGASNCSFLLGRFIAWDMRFILCCGRSMEYHSKYRADGSSITGAGIVRSLYWIIII